MGIASELREGMDNMADAVRTLAGVLASCAAAQHSGDYGAQRDMAGVIFADAQSRFAEVMHKLSDKQRAEMEAMIDSLCRGKK